MPQGGEAYGAWYDADAAQIAASFFPTYLRHTEAEWYGQPFILQPWQEWEIIRPVYGWKRADGTRLIRVVYIELPRKNGKTEFAAGISLLALMADGEFGGQCYSMAVDKDQAKIVFNKAGVMVSLSPELSDHAEVFKTSIYVPDLMSSFKPLSHTPGAKHGFSPTFAIGDELHEWPTGELHDVVHKGTAARRQPLEVLITTAGRPGEGYGWEMHQYAEQVRDGLVEDPTFLPLIYAADPDDDWTSPETWAKANPNYEVSVKADYLKTEVTRAEGKADKIADFKRYHLNIWSDVVAGGLPMDEWDQMPIRSVTLEALVGRPVWGGLDLSSTTDLTALALVAANDEGGYDCYWHFWMPLPSSKAIAERSRNDRVPYSRWIGDGWITGTPGNVVDYDVIRSTISGWMPTENESKADAIRQITGGVSIIEQLDLRELAIDRWNATQITSQLGEDGVTVVPFGQGFASMTAPTKELERLIKAGKWNHGGNPVARWMAGCTEIMSDGAENCKPIKPDRRKSTKRIDGIVAAIMALGRAAVNVAQDDGYDYTGM